VQRADVSPNAGATGIEELLGEQSSERRNARQGDCELRANADQVSS